MTATAEEVGLDSAFVTDHVLVRRSMRPSTGRITEALVTLGFLIGRTRRIELGVSALVVPLRNPYVVLKQLASLDFLSGGRIVTAIAAGWMEGEFRTLGADFEHRGRATNDWIELAKAAFAQDPGPLEHRARSVSEDAWLEPSPARRGGPELWVAGVSPATLRRAARTGVWHPVALPPRGARPHGIGVPPAAARRAGRDAPRRLLRRRAQAHGRRRARPSCRRRSSAVARRAAGRVRRGGLRRLRAQPRSREARSRRNGCSSSASALPGRCGQRTATSGPSRSRG